MAESPEFKIVRRNLVAVRACISAADIVNFAGELFQDGIISDAGHQAAINTVTGTAPNTVVARLVSEAMNKLSNSSDNFYRFVSIIESRDATLASILKNDYDLHHTRTVRGTARAPRFDQAERALGRPGMPGKPHATNVTHNSLVLGWGKPQYGADSVHPIETRRVPLTERMLLYCKHISSHDGVKIYLLPTLVTTRKSGYQKVTVSHPQHLAVAAHKVLLLVGATGAGKSSLINAMANYIMGVDWEDEYRFKLISEETAHDQTKSQTKCITAYTFHKQEGSRLPYTLTVIDTPGFGDTGGGLERDKEIIQQMKDLLTAQGDEGIDQLHGIGFVTQAPLGRLTPTQRYVFDSILSVFGKDVADNIFLMVTFADGKRPPVLDAARAAGVPFKNYFQFNNCALFACDEFDKIFWEMGKKSVEDFFNHFSKAETRSLQLSREVLQEREQIEVTIQGLQPQIRAGLVKIDELRQERQLLKDHEADIIANRNFTCKVQISKQRKIDLPPGQYSNICLKCNITCHYNCSCALNDSEKYKCHAMNNRGSKNATCRVCPGKCSWTLHFHSPYRFEIYQDQETRTSYELKAKYESAMKMEEELIEMEQAVLQNMSQAKQSLQRLQEIALRPGHLTDVEYIDLMIESEKYEARPDWMQRVSAIREVRQQAEIIAIIQKEDTQSTNGLPPRLWEKFKSLSIK